MTSSDIAHQFARIDALRAEWIAVNAAIARLEAQRARILSARSDGLLADAPPGSFHHGAGFRSMVADFAAAVHHSSGPVEGAFCRADTLIHRLPATTEALAEGALSIRHADVIVSASGPFARAEVEKREQFEHRVLEVAVEESPARTAAFAKAVAAAEAPQDVTARHEGARMTRGVHLTPLDDGMAQLSAIIPEVLGRAVIDRLTGLARVVLDDGHAQDDRAQDGHAQDDRAQDGRAQDGPAGLDASPEDARDTRTLNNVRADVLVDPLLAAHTETVNRTAEESISATVQVTIAATTLAGTDDRLAELDGHGPLVPGIARSLAGNAGSWCRLFLDAEGMAVATDTCVPTAGMKRFLRARDRHCRFPGCRMPTHRCQIDHNHDHARGGKTEIGNLCHFCTTHHVFTHPDVDTRYRWNARQLPGGIIEWTSPEDAVYIDKPPPRVMFV